MRETSPVDGRELTQNADVGAARFEGNSNLIDPDTIARSIDPVRPISVQGASIEESERARSTPPARRNPFPPGGWHAPAVGALPDNIQIMPRLLTADDIMSLVASLPDSERIKLLRRIASPRGDDVSAYVAAPPKPDEFSGDDEPIAWDAEGWDEFHSFQP
jgi:hypothetical protein